MTQQAVVVIMGLLIRTIVSNTKIIKIILILQGI